MKQIKKDLSKMKTNKSFNRSNKVFNINNHKIKRILITIIQNKGLNHRETSNLVPTSYKVSETCINKVFSMCLDQISYKQALKGPNLGGRATKSTILADIWVLYYPQKTKTSHITKKASKKLYIPNNKINGGFEWI
jgi:hypothetical protein